MGREDVANREMIARWHCLPPYILQAILALTRTAVGSSRTSFVMTMSGNHAILT
jgi:hypothetical protein